MSPSLSILVVDDEPSARTGLRHAIVACGHRCSTAADGDDAARLLAHAHFDVVISDWRMPRMSGIELCRELRAHEESLYTYFILVTAMNDREHRLEALAAGADEFLSKPIDVEELRLRLSGAERLVTGQRQMRRDSEGAAVLARMDALTGVGNRLRMEEDLHALVSDAERYDHASSLAFFDIDNFKQWNDTHGHVDGDRILKEVAYAIRHAVRAADRVYRYGGEEFVVTLPHQTAAEAALVAERIRAAVAAACPVTVSAGVAQLAPNATAQDWISAADAALYRAKARGRDRVVVAD